MSKDTIYRQDAIDALKSLEESVPTAQHLSAIFDCEDVIMGMPSAQPTQPNTSNTLKALDCISRKDAIDAVETKIKKWNAVDGEGYHVGLGLRYVDVIDTLAELPSAQPEIIRCEECMHNGSFDTDCPINWAGKDYCNFAERRTDE